MRQTILPSPSIIIHTNNRCDSSQSISMHEYSNYSGDRADQMMECQQTHQHLAADLWPGFPRPGSFLGAAAASA